MIQLRRSGERGVSKLDWLDSRHSFSFGEYHDPAHMGFGSLRVINEDFIAPGQGFGTHPHRDMEILTFVLEGELQHRDSLGTGSVIRPGDAQRMSAGTGVLHSEFNASQSERVHLLQIWILPERRGIEPGYEQKTFSERERRGALRLLASRSGRDGSLTVHQDADLWTALLEPGETLMHSLRPGRQAWLQIARGALSVNGQALGPGDAVALTDEKELAIRASDSAEILLFDLA